MPDCYATWAHPAASLKEKKRKTAVLLASECIDVLDGMQRFHELGKRSQCELFFCLLAIVLKGIAQSHLDRQVYTAVMQGRY